MNFLKKLSDLFIPPARIDEWSYWVTVQCHRCGEQIKGRVDLRNDLSPEYDDNGKTMHYYCRKVLMSSEAHCFQQIEVILKFDTNHKLIDKEITGGKFVEE